MQPLLRACWLGLTRYPDAHQLQTALVSRVISGAPEVLLLLEHTPVITAGRSCPRDQIARLVPLLPPDVDVVEVERGGHLTFHGPGQLVAYPIVHLSRVDYDLHRWLEVLENAAAATLSRFGVSAKPGGKDRRGVWVGGRKIASVGVAVRRWVSFHGVAINVRRCWRPPVPITLCQLPLETYTSLEEIGVNVEPRAVGDVFAHELSRACGFRGLTWNDRDQLT